MSSCKNLIHGVSLIRLLARCQKVGVQIALYCRTCSNGQFMKQHMRNKTIFFKKWPSKARLDAHLAKTLSLIGFIYPNLHVFCAVCDNTQILVELLHQCQICWPSKNFKMTGRFETTLDWPVFSFDVHQSVKSIPYGLKWMYRKLRSCKPHLGSHSYLVNQMFGPNWESFNPGLTILQKRPSANVLSTVPVCYYTTTEYHRLERHQKPLSCNLIYSQNCIFLSSNVIDNL